MYKVFLPKTEYQTFAKSEVEKKIGYWSEINLYSQRKEKRSEAKSFILHDGPPYANGPIHMGHAENKIYKDVLNRMFWASGYNTPYIPGWDAHGLPIENAVEKELKKKGIEKKSLDRSAFWDECFNFAKGWMLKQRDSFEKIGIADIKGEYYATFLEEESVGIINCIHGFVKKGLIEQRFRPVLWSLAEKTALAYAEVEYKDKVSKSLYVSFKVKSSDFEDLVGANLIIWTTTAWTLPANKIVCYNEDFSYVIFKSEGKKYCIQEDLIKKVDFENIEIIKTFEGKLLKNTICKHPLSAFEEDRPLFSASFVDKERGSGFVHVAPAHGEDDFKVCVDNKVDFEDLLDNLGCFKAHVPLVGEMSVKNAGEAVIEELEKEGSLIKVEEITHSYPHSWRSKSPLIFRLTKQWYLKISQIKDKAMEAVMDENLKWVPQEGKNRFLAMLKNRDDWCISRQRIWGVPISIFFKPETGEVLNDPEFLEKTREKLSQVGVKNWWNLSCEDIDPKYSAKEWVRLDDIVDIWFESGSTQSFVLQKKNLFPADVYLEGSDQHRGWFQSSLLVSAFEKGRAPWKSLITHGFCLDANKTKMSKSLGNVVDPLSWDADELRLFFCSLMLTKDVNLNEQSIQSAKGMLARFKNTVRFLIGVSNMPCKEFDKGMECLPDLEKWVLSKLKFVSDSYSKVLKDYQIFNFVKDIYEFCDQDLSSFYFDIRKDDLYCNSKDDEVRSASVYCCKILADSLIKLLSPILAFSGEDMWQTFCKEQGVSLSSVHLESRPEIGETFFFEKSYNEIEKIRSLRKKVNEEIEKLREEKLVNNSYDVAVKVPENVFCESLKKILIVSHVEVSKDDKIHVEKAMGEKCSRCKFFYKETVSHVIKGGNKDGSDRHGLLCGRCEKEVL